MTPSRPAEEPSGNYNAATKDYIIESTSLLEIIREDLRRRFKALGTKSIRLADFEEKEEEKTKGK